MKIQKKKMFFFYLFIFFFFFFWGGGSGRGDVRGDHRVDMNKELKFL